ncbi:hypothetical protein [Veillonella sp.]
MFDAKEAYELVCEAIDRIDRKDKFNEFETIFERNKNDTQKVKQENSNDEVKSFAANFYKAPIVNYKGYVKGAIQEDKNRYSEVISSTLLSKNLLKAWKELTPVRPNHFDTKHDHSESVEMEQLQGTNRKEEILAKLLFYQYEVDGLGYIFDYQTPLKRAKNDSYGKIDLLGFNQDDKCYSVIELKYRPSGSDETLLRCILEAYTYYKLLDLKQIKSDVGHAGIKELKELPKYKHTDKTELVILFDEKSCMDEDGGAETNLMLRIVSDEVNKANYPSNTVESQQHKECKELIDSSKRKELRTLCEEILAQEPNLKQIRFVVLRADTDSKSSYPTNIKGWSRKLDRLYRAETLLTIPK